MNIIHIFRSIVSPATWIQNPDSTSKNSQTVKFRYVFQVITFLFTFYGQLVAQGPELSHFYNPQTSISWASCTIVPDNGVQQKIGFFPVINEKTNAPLGIKNYTCDVDINQNIVFIANGVSIPDEADCYHNADVEDKVVMFFEQIPDTLGNTKPDQSLAERIMVAIENKALAVVIVSADGSYPLYTVSFDKEIPAVSIDKQGAISLLEIAGIDYKFLLEQIQNNNFPTPKALPVRIKLHIDGKFEVTETENFAYHYHPDMISLTGINQLKNDNERSITFLLDLFDNLKFEWGKEQIYYFDDFDSKIFYTGYWGIGFSCETGVYNVYFKEDTDYGLAVHENAHSLLRKNGLRYSSFFDEGIARYAEAMATGKDINNEPTVGFLRKGELFRLDEMFDFNIGKNPKETEIGYPVAGSFVEYLIGHSGTQMAVSLSTQKTNPQARSEILGFEKPWLEWLQNKYGFDDLLIVNHFHLKKNTN